MKRILIIAAICCSMPAIADDIKTSGSENFDLDAYRGRRVHLEFVSSPKLTADLRQRFELLGFGVTTLVEEADVSVKVDSVFVFQKPHTTAQWVDFGTVVEKTDPDLVNRKVDASTRAPRFELGLITQGLTQNISANMVLGASLVSTIMDMTGARSWFNNLLVGDARGICLGTAEMCKDWKKYTQKLRLTTLITVKGGRQTILRSEAETKNEELIPDQLFTSSMGDLTGRLLASSSLEVPKVDEIKPIP